MVRCTIKSRIILNIFLCYILIFALSESILASEIPPPQDWTEQGIVLDKGPPGAWDDNGNYVRVGSVVKKNGTYFLYYAGSSGSGCSDGGVDYRAIGVATSTDGINFTKYSGNPIITWESPNHATNPCEEGAGFPVVALDDNGDFVMFWEAISATGPTSVDGDVHYSTSSDGFNFTDQGGVPGLTASENWPVGVLHAQGGTSSLTGTWHLWFMSDQFGPYSVHLATGNTPGNLTRQATGPVINRISRAEWPVLHSDGTVSLFDASGGWSPTKLDVLETTVNNLDTYSSPVMTFPAPSAGFYATVCVLQDTDDNLLRMYYTDADHYIRLRTAPISVTDSTPSTIPQNLATTVISDTQIDISWEASTDPESGISGYKIYRDDSLIGQTTTTSFSNTGLTEGTTYTYRVSAVNGVGLESEKSAPVSANTLADDVTPPSIASVSATGEPTAVMIVYSEQVEETSATNLSNYSINNDMTISGASLDTNLKTVSLTTSPHSESVTYTLTVNNVRDRATTPNTIAPNTKANYTFVAKLIISNLSVGSGRAYEVIESGLQNGAVVYTDRSYTFLSLPTWLQGTTYIKTANEDKSSSGTSFITFDVNQNVTVYVAHDDRILTKPNWLQSFVDIGEDIVTMQLNNTNMSLFSKNFSPSTIVLGGNGGTAEGSMYSIIIVPEAGTDTTPPAAPTGLTILEVK